MSRYRPQRQHRYDTLKGEFFTAAEAEVLSQFEFNLPYIQMLRQDREELVDDVKSRGLNRRDTLIELRNEVDLVYYINDWKDAWAMIRDYRQRTIDRGEYTEPLKKRRRPLDKGNVAAQKRRYRARKSAERQGRTGVQFDSEGRVIGWVEYNQESGRFEDRYA